jgi:glycosyltransferase involved in cell wall biosynthesis
VKVLLVGFSCSPYHGSEPGTTWNWAWHLSADNEVWAIVHPQFRDEVEHYLRDHPNPNLHVVFVALPKWLDPWKFAASERWTRLSYLLWLRATLRKARELHKVHTFDVAHQVTMGTVGAPSPIWRLGVPFIWGSLGGGQTAPPAFKKYFGSSWRSEVIRTIRVRTLRFVPSLRKASHHSSLLLATNHETKLLLETAGGKHTRYFLDCGTLPHWLAPSLPARRLGNQLTLLWSGRLEARKGLPLAIEALAQLGDRRVRLVVTGRGPQRAYCEQLVRAFGLGDSVQFLGYVQQEDLEKLFDDADAFMFTSLRDSSGSVVLEAMAQGLPVLVLDHHGVGAFVPDDAGIKVPVTTPSETVAGLAQGMRLLLERPNVRQTMGHAGWLYAKAHTWESRARQMGKWYKECLDRAS